MSEYYKQKTITIFFFLEFNFKKKVATKNVNMGKDGNLDCERWYNTQLKLDGIPDFCVFIVQCLLQAWHMNILLVSKIYFHPVNMMIF